MYLHFLDSIVVTEVVKSTKRIVTFLTNYRHFPVVKMDETPDVSTLNRRTGLGSLLSEPPLFQQPSSILVVAPDCTLPNALCDIPYSPVSSARRQLIVANVRAQSSLPSIVFLTSSFSRPFALSKMFSIVNPGSIQL